jgi:hypothetical protein
MMSECAVAGGVSRGVVQQQRWQLSVTANFKAVRWTGMRIPHQVIDARVSCHNRV